MPPANEDPRRLLELMRILAAEPELESTLVRLGQLLAETIGADRCVVAFVNGGSLRSPTAQGVVEVDEASDLPASVLRWVMDHGALALDDPATEITVGRLEIEALRVPHAGYPERHGDVENIVFRVTLDEHMTVMHLGDADTVDAHFAVQPDFWTERLTDVAFPPYWFFLNEEGRAIVENRLNARRAIGIHVPANMPNDPDKRPDELRGFELFTRPTEARTVDLRAQ